MDTKHSKAERLTENWCRTHVNVVEANFTWTISNFSFCNEKPGEALESSIFSATNNDVLKWRMQFYPNGNNQENKDYVSLFLHLINCDKPTIKVDFAFYILNKESREVNERKTTEKWQFYQGRQSGFPKFIKRENLLDRDNGLLPGDKLRLVCRVRSATGDVQRLSQDAFSPSPPDLLLQMSDNFEMLLERDTFSDVRLVASDNTSIAAHKNILAARSPVFFAMFEHNMKERQENAVEIYDLDTETLKAMLKFIYSGKIDDIDLKADKLLGAADKYALEGLKSICEQTLCRCLNVQDAAETLLLAELHNSTMLKSKTLTFIRLHLKDILETQAFKDLTISRPSLLEEILRTMTIPQ